MACVSRSVISVAANSCSSNVSFSFKPQKLNRKFGTPEFTKLRIRASSDQSDDCNVEECAPDKEVGKLSREWLAGDNTKVVGTFPPRKKGWTGYIEKDTAGQTNIYSVEPTVYVAESVLSSGNAGSSSDGAENTAAIAGGLALIAIAAASSILLQVGKTPPPQVQFSGPSLSYYITKFKPLEVVQASAPSPSQSSTTLEEAPPQVLSTESEPAAQSESENPALSIEPETATQPEPEKSVLSVEAEPSTQSETENTSLAVESVSQVS